MADHDVLLHGDQMYQIGDCCSSRRVNADLTSCVSLVSGLARVHGDSDQAGSRHLTSKACLPWLTHALLVRCLLPALLPCTQVQL